MKFSKKTLLMAASIILCMTMTALGTVAYLTDRTAVANTFTVGNIDITVDEEIVDEYGKPKEDLQGKKLVDDDNNPDTPSKPMTEDEYEAWVDKQIAEDETLTEDDFEEFKDLPDADRTEVGNKYKLIPGMTYTKDPTMTVKAGSESAYLRMVVQMNKASALKEVFGADFLPENFVQGWKASEWPCVGIVEGEDDTLTYVFNYHEIVDQSSATEDLKLTLFTNIVVPTTVEPEDLQKLQGFEIEIEGQAIQSVMFDNAAEAWEAFGEQYSK